MLSAHLQSLSKCMSHLLMFLYLFCILNGAAVTTEVPLWEAIKVLYRIVLFPNVVHRIVPNLTEILSEPFETIC